MTRLFIRTRVKTKTKTWRLKIKTKPLILWCPLLPYGLSVCNRMATITNEWNDGLTRSGKGCFVAVSIWQQWASKWLTRPLFFVLEALDRRPNLDSRGLQYCKEENTETRKHDRTVEASVIRNKWWLSVTSVTRIKWLMVDCSIYYRCYLPLIYKVCFVLVFY